jgi:hypothetical protein
MNVSRLSQDKNTLESHMASYREAFIGQTPVHEQKIPVFNELEMYRLYESRSKDVDINGQNRKIDW